MQPGYPAVFRNLSLAGLGVLMVATLGAMCEGPAGPQGTSGSSESITLELVRSPAALRADGVSETRIAGWVKTASGANVPDITVSFQVFSGGGSVSPAEAPTDARGMAYTTFRCGDQPGYAVIVGSMHAGGLEVTAAESLFLDPLTVSPPILAHDWPGEIQSRWSADGSHLLIEPSTYDDYSLYSVPVSGGEPSLIGRYRGGDWSQDGRDRIAVGEDAGLSILNSEGQKILGPTMPSGFSGKVRDVLWIRGGDSLLVASSYGDLYVCDPEGSVCSQLSSYCYSTVLSTRLGSSTVWLDDSYSRCITELDLGSRSFRRFGLFIPMGHSVDPYGDRLVLAVSSLSAPFGSHDLISVPSNAVPDEVLLASPADEIYPSWSPDGTKIAFCSDRSGSGYNLYVLKVRDPGMQRARGEEGSR